MIVIVFVVPCAMAEEKFSDGTCRCCAGNPAVDTCDAAEDVCKCNGQAACTGGKNCTAGLCTGISRISFSNIICQNIDIP